MQIASSDFAAQARNAALQAGQGIQSTARGAAESFNKFVEGQEGSGAAGRRNVEPERKDFWDSFGASANAEPLKPSSIGTSAMKSGSGGTASGSKGKDDGWEEW